LTIDKTVSGNIEQRIELLKSARANLAMQRDLMDMCKASVLFWINLFAWTYNVKAVGPDGRERPAQEQHVPFITWPVQDDSVLQTVECIDNGVDLVSDKSRDMGESWKYIAIADWYWLFHNDSHMLLVSRVEDGVDKRGDPDSLFWKIDYINANLPEWMVPGDPSAFQWGGEHRRYLQLENPIAKCTISGQATTGHVGRGGRRKFVLFDEMAAIEHATAAWQSAADTTACRIGNSTPLGPGTEFTKQRNNGIMHGRPRVITVGYWDHPLKGRGREWRIDEDGSITGLAGRGYWWTPWFAEEVKRRQDPADIGQNILIDHITSGKLFFNSTIVTNHMRDHGRDPVRCELSEAGFVPDDRGRWHVWCQLDDDGKPSKLTNYVGFADLSHGRGSSNSVAAFMDVANGEVAAEFVDPNVSTYDLADEVCDAGKRMFNGDREQAFLGYETNGPGEGWHRDLFRNGYHAFYRKRQVTTKSEPVTREFGWRSGRREKRILLGSLGRAMARKDIIIHSKPGMNEMLEYVFFDDGSIGPGTLRDETSGAREAHGDRVIAYAGCVMMRAERSQYDLPPEQPKPGTANERFRFDEQLAKLRAKMRSK